MDERQLDLIKKVVAEWLLIATPENIGQACNSDVGDGWGEVWGEVQELFVELGGPDWDAENETTEQYHKKIQDWTYDDISE